MSNPDMRTKFSFLENAVEITANAVRIIDIASIRKNIIKLAKTSALGMGEEKQFAHHIIKLAALDLGIVPASIHELYMARGRQEVPFSFVVPAMNLRILPFHAACMIFRCAKRIAATALIFEIARSEMGYTDQRPDEYTAQVLAAAIAEEYQGPVFIQGDHFQISANKFATDPNSELRAVRELIKEAISAGFYNIDIDTSTMVDLKKRDVKDQQKNNIELSGMFCQYIREHQPEGVIVSVGGEIGEVGGHNSTEIELHAYLDGFARFLCTDKKPLEGLSKVSVQTGTSHGGVVLPDGSIAKVNVDFDTLKNLSRVARKNYGLGGTVQHGASTLPEDAFGKFVEAEAIEVHLATNFANIFFDLIPDVLRLEMYKFIDDKYKNDRKSDMSDEQFYYKMRKNIIGAFKEKCWNLPIADLEKIQTAWLVQFQKLFSALGIADTRKWTEKYIKLVKIQPNIQSNNVAFGKDTEASKLAD